jgi:L-gulonolactone oxidase
MTQTVSQIWRNWAGNQSASGITFRHPRTVGEIVELVRQAGRDGRRVKAIGSGHSFTGIGRPEDIQLVLSQHANVLALDSAAGLVTVAAGMPLHRLGRLLADAGLSLTNLGDIDRQTVAGALATGTHGTGARFGGLATQVRALQLVLADGSVLDCSPTDNAEIFRAARIGLGALGIVCTVTLQTEPAFGLRAVERPIRLAEVLERFAELADGADHFEFYWFPHTGSALTKTNHRVALDGLAPQPRWREVLVDEVLSNGVFGASIALSRRAPVVTKPLNRIAARALGSRTFTDHSHKVFTSPRRVRFVEMEYAVPRAAIVDVVRELQRTIEANKWRIPFPIEVRVAAADDIPLSTAIDRDTAYLAVHLPRQVEIGPYFRAVERIAGQVAGRPHWGKLHSLGAAELRARYPRFDEFVALRDRLDPTGLFSNAYLDRVLGPPPGRR